MIFYKNNYKLFLFQIMATLVHNMVDKYHFLMDEQSGKFSAISLLGELKVTYFLISTSRTECGKRPIVTSGWNKSLLTKWRIWKKPSTWFWGSRGLQFLHQRELLGYKSYYITIWFRWIISVWLPIKGIKTK